MFEDHFTSIVLKWKEELGSGVLTYITVMTSSLNLVEHYYSMWKVTTLSISY